MYTITTSANTHEFTLSAHCEESPDVDVELTPAKLA